MSRFRLLAFVAPAALLCLLLVAPAYADSLVPPGPITASVGWSSGGSPYLLQGSVLIIRWACFR